MRARSARLSRNSAQNIARRQGRQYRRRGCRALAEIETGGRSAPASCRRATSAPCHQRRHPRAPGTEGKITGPGSSEPNDWFPTDTQMPRKPLAAITAETMSWCSIVLSEDQRRKGRRANSPHSVDQATREVLLEGGEGGVVRWKPGEIAGERRQRSLQGRIDPVARGRPESGGPPTTRLSGS